MILEKTKENLAHLPFDTFLKETKGLSSDEKVLWSEIWRRAYLYAPEEFTLPAGDTSDVAGLPLLFAWARKQGLCQPYLLSKEKQSELAKAFASLQELLPTLAFPELWVLNEGSLLDEVRLLTHENNSAWSFSPFALLRFTVLLDPGYEATTATVLHEALHAAIDEFVAPGQDLLAKYEARLFNEDFIQLLVGDALGLDPGPLAPFRGDKDFLLEITALHLLDESHVLEGF